MTAGLFFCPESQKIRDQDSLGRGSDRVCRWSFGAAGLFVLWKPHREGGFWGSFFGRSASWRRLMIPIYFMYGNRMTMGNRNEVKI